VVGRYRVTAWEREEEEYCLEADEGSVLENDPGLVFLAVILRKVRQLELIGHRAS
jgi:hypothetical protein